MVVNPKDKFSCIKVHLTLCLLALPTDNICKQFGSRSDPTFVGSDLDPN